MDGLRPVIDLLASGAGAVQHGAGFAVGTSVLALVFLWSGGAKLRHPDRASLAIVNFRLAKNLRAWHGLGLALLEVALGLLLLSGYAAQPALAFATLLFAGFSLLIARALAQHERFSCSCFGSGNDELTWLTLVRTLGLMLVAGLMALAAASVPVRDAGDVQTYLQLTAASGVVLGTLAASRIGRLLRWNREVTNHFRARAAECAP